jgi:hypothetical protein
MSDHAAQALGAAGETGMTGKDIYGRTLVMDQTGIHAMLQAYIPYSIFSPREDIGQILYFIGKKYVFLCFINWQWTWKIILTEILLITLKETYRNHCRVGSFLLLSLAVFNSPAFGAISVNMYLTRWYS